VKVKHLCGTLRKKLVDVLAAENATDDYDIDFLFKTDTLIPDAKAIIPWEGVHSP
jgi:hypothetical protein